MNCAEIDTAKSQQQQASSRKFVESEQFMKFHLEKLKFLIRSQ